MGVVIVAMFESSEKVISPSGINKDFLYFVFVLYQHDAALDTIKQLITEAPVLQYYKRKKEVTIKHHISDYGLGVVLMQEGQLVA